MRGQLAPVAYDWIEIILVREGTCEVIHRREGARDLARPGHVVVLMPNVPCGIRPEGQVRVTRLFYRPLFVVQQLQWADPSALPHLLAAWSRFERAELSQVVDVAGTGWAELAELAGNLVALTETGRLRAGYLSAASWALRILAIIESQLAAGGAHGLFVADADLVNRPTEPCFGKVLPLHEGIALVADKIRERFMEQHTVEMMAGWANLSPSQFRRKFTQQIGKTPKAYQDMVRVRRMAELLLSTEYSVARIAQMVGWFDPSRAAHVFKEAATMPPRDYRRSFGEHVPDRPRYAENVMFNAVTLTFGS
jgi:AraC-like DNA-binding protein